MNNNFKKRTTNHVIILLLIMTLGSASLAFSSQSDTPFFVDEIAAPEAENGLFYRVSNSEQNENTISGTVVDTNGVPLPGVSVYVKGTTIGISTNLDGFYSFIIPDNAGILVFSYLGTTTQEIPIDGRSTINVTLVEESLGVDEVVVTALGIKREKKSLGYSVQEVKGDELTKAKELDVVNSLSGKVAGVNITQGSGDLGGGGSRIVIRGETSLAGNNEPLFVIDGVPGGSNDVASDDIESISVLKGPAAAALYGSRAAAGVILITTKSGAGKKGLGLEVNSSTTFQNPLVLPNYQNEYGQGKAGRYSYYDGNNGGIEDDTDLNWGPKFDGNDRAQFSGIKPWVAHPNNVRDFYQTGVILNNNVALSGSDENGNFRFSYTNITQKGIIPNTGMTKNQFDLNGGWIFAKKLNLKANIKYIKEQSDNTRSYNPRFIPRNIDFNALEEYWVPGQEGYQQLSWRRSSDNPYFLLHENTNSYNTHKVLGSLVLTYDFNKHLSLMARGGTNFGNRNYESREAFSTAGSETDQNGSYKNGHDNSEQTNTDFLITYDNYLFNELLSVKVSAGGNHMRAEGYDLEGYINQLVYLGIYNLGNYGETPQVKNSISKKEVNSLYAFANFGYRSYLYLDVTARNDWSSTLPVNNNSYFYSSYALTGVMNEIITLPKAINFWKLRASYAEVGNDTDPYRLETVHNWKNGDIAELSQNSTKANSDLKPEITKALELGTDFRTFNNRFSLDITYYNSVTSNQIIKLETSVASRYQYWMLNAGKIRNKGLELMIAGTPVKTTDFEWNVQFNWSRDRAYIEELLPGQVDEVTTAVTSHLFIIDKVGERRGAFYGRGYDRAPNGEILLDKSGDTKRGPEKFLGNYNPDWMASLSNSITYRNFSLNFLFDFRYGGMMYSSTLYNMNIKGLSAATTLGDREGIVPNGMVEDNGSYRPITIDDMGGKGMSGEQYWANMMDSEIPEAVMEDATYLKLRELRFSYQLPEKMMKKLSLSAVSVALVGRNLAVWTAVQHIDPEIFSNSNGQQVLGYDSSNIPSVRNIGFNINLKF
jgi:TonB-linked SusC/RagA family outer membrane protein